MHKRHPPPGHPLKPPSAGPTAVTIDRRMLPATCTLPTGTGRAPTNAPQALRPWLRPRQISKTSTPRAASNKPVPGEAAGSNLTPPAALDASTLQHTADGAGRADNSSHGALYTTAREVTAPALGDPPFAILGYTGSPFARGRH